MDITQVLKKLDFDEKEIRVYLILLSLGPAPVRKIAQTSGINRGTSYDILKKLMGHGLVGYFQKAKKQYFVAEDPIRLEHLLVNRLSDLAELKEIIKLSLPELRSLYNKGGEKPVVHYFEGAAGVRQILNDVLETAVKSEKKRYFVYSSSGFRDHLYKKFPNFTKERINRGIHCDVVAMGQGGVEDPLAERKWLSKEQGSPSYIIIYPPKVAYFCFNSSKEILGVVINDEAIAKTQQMIFEKIWQTI